MSLSSYRGKLKTVNMTDAVVEGLNRVANAQGKTLYGLMKVARVTSSFVFL